MQKLPGPARNDAQPNAAGDERSRGRALAHRAEKDDPSGRHETEGEGFPLRIASLVVAVGLAAVAAPSRAEVGSYLLFDMASGAVIAEHEASRLWYPASITKLMTVYVTLEAVRDGKIAMTSPVRISPQAFMQPPSRMGFAIGSVVTVETAVRILMTKSANDLAVALAEAVGGTQRGFVDLMNGAADRLDMTSTRFDNPHGLPNTVQVTTARDLALMMMALAREFPEHGALFALSGVKLANTVMANNNTLIRRFAGADGMKTGFICASGFNVAATATRDGRRLGAVVLGGLTASERDERTGELLAKGFEAVATGGAVALDGFGDIEDRLALAPVSGMRPPPGRVAALAAAQGEAVDRRAEVCGSARPLTRYDDGTVEAVADVVEQRRVILAYERRRTEGAARRALVLALPRPEPVPLPEPEPPTRIVAEPSLAPDGWIPHSLAATPLRDPRKAVAAPQPRRVADEPPAASDWVPYPAGSMPPPSPHDPDRNAAASGASAVALAARSESQPAPGPPADDDPLAGPGWVPSPALPPANPLHAAGLRDVLAEARPPARPLTYLSPPTALVPVVVRLGGADAARPDPLSGPIVGGGPPPMPAIRPERPAPGAGTAPVADATDDATLATGQGSEAGR